MKIRLTTQEDYPELCQWWQDWRWTPPSVELLDHLRFGVMVHDGTTNICAGFLYFTNAKAFGLLEYVVSNFNVKDRNMRKQALELLIDTLLGIAKQRNVKVVFSSLKNQSLIATYKNCGFITGSTQTTEMICIL